MGRRAIRNVSSVNLCALHVRACLVQTQRSHKLQMLRKLTGMLSVVNLPALVTESYALWVAKHKQQRVYHLSNGRVAELAVSKQQTDSIGGQYRCPSSTYLELRTP